MKVSALATVLMDYPLKLNDIAREGIRGLSMEQVQSAKMMGRPYKLVCQAERLADGTVVGSVRPEQVPNDEPLVGCSALPRAARPGSTGRGLGWPQSGLV